MRFFTVILSIYVLVLTIAPCPENSTTIEDVCMIATECNDMGDHPHQTDICSPFCHCHCCQTHIANSDIPSLIPILTITSQIYTQPTNVIKDISFSILQPPQYIS